MRVSPTQRTLKWLRSEGYTVGITERWNTFARIRQDLFGFCDLVCLKEGEPITAVQTTSGANHAARREKVLGIAAAKLWAERGRIWIVSWAKQGARGKRKLWTVRCEEIGINDF